MGDKLKFFCKTVVFLLLLALILVPVQRVMARKSLSGTWDMTNKVAGFYNEEEDQFEVMFFGPSHAYAAFSPLVIWGPRRAVLFLIMQLASLNIDLVER